MTMAFVLKVVSTNKYVENFLYYFLSFDKHALIIQLSGAQCTNFVKGKPCDKVY